MVAAQPLHQASCSREMAAASWCDHMLHPFPPPAIHPSPQGCALATYIATLLSSATQHPQYWWEKLVY